METCMAEARRLQFLDEVVNSVSRRSKDVLPSSKRRFEDTEASLASAAGGSRKSSDYFLNAITR